MTRADLSKPLSVRGHAALAWLEARQRAVARGAREAARFVSASEVAAVCGLDAYTLDTRHRPDGWACPRDFVFARGRVLMYARASLPQLAAGLAEAGLAQAAEALRAWIAAGSGGKGDVSREAASPQTAAAPARTPEGGWAKQWEEAHEQ